MKTESKERGNWEATLRNLRALKRRVERLEKLLGIKRKSTPR